MVSCDLTIQTTLRAKPVFGVDAAAVLGWVHVCLFLFVDYYTSGWQYKMPVQVVICFQVFVTLSCFESLSCVSAINYWHSFHIPPSLELTSSGILHLKSRISSRYTYIVILVLARDYQKNICDLGEPCLTKGLHSCANTYKPQQLGRVYFRRVGAQKWFSHEWNTSDVGPIVSKFLHE